MTSETSSDAHTSQARIRDNQRRSRARKKEYISELETKWRQCEVTGIEASAQIQLAARKVVEENKRLRELLRRKGVPEAEIESSSTSDGVSPLSAAETLEAMLGAKWICGGGGACEANSPASSSCSSLQPKIPLASQTQTQTFQPEQPPISSLWQQQYHPQIYEKIPSTGPSNSLENMAPSFPPPPNIQNEFYPTIAPAPTQDSHWQPMIDPSAYLEQMATYNTSSCRTVTSAIRSVRPDMGQELEAEMGCRDGQDCNVPNMTAFDLIDRFSGT